MGEKGYEKEFPSDADACDADGLYTSVDITFSTVAEVWGNGWTGAEAKNWTKQMEYDEWCYKTLDLYGWTGLN